MRIQGNSSANFGITIDDYREFYDQQGGFDTEFSHNTRDIDEPLGEIMVRGGVALVQENPDLVKTLWCD